MPESHRVKLFEAMLALQAGDTAVTPASVRLPLSLYTSEETLTAERDLYGHFPLPLCHASQLATPGAALVNDYLGLPLVTVRDHAGEIRSFLNVCRHRNMRLVNKPGLQTLRSFVCPYHQWTYGLDGGLRNIPQQDSFVDVDKTDFNLVPLPTELRHGLVWVQLSESQRPFDLDTSLASIGTALDAFELEGAKFYTQSVREIRCNWKLIQDAFLDGYHVTRLHKDTVGPFFKDCLAVSMVEGKHILSAVARKEFEQVSELPQADWDFRAHATFSFTLFPNSVVIMHPDYISLLSLYPQAPDKTVLVHSMLVANLPATDKEKARFDQSFELIDKGVFEAEDIFVSEGAQAGMKSGANTHMLLGGHESAIAQFHEILNTTLQEFSA